ncbi:TonB-dependent receptor domain-containing protein [Pseudidiomarina halophila]|uniref:TonB-dependent receptor n=2 Tax=Pseudidiomarina halophila TaxID=1449799 RepID=A0A432XZ11_9GAMM|nr:TonB-dependent receptor [Pseudidiomarina halophila]RUO53956.1 TonB-dependent receptor [Pseudidiomarina halophila]
MYKNSKMAKSIRLALMFGGASLAMSGTAAAQAQADEEQAEEAQERITVTGSRIKRTDYESSSPVQITSSEEIKASGFTRIEDLMNSLPQVEAAQTSFIANGASGVATLDLRGIGVNRTLVLMNGRRLQPGGVYSQAPDVNQIPAALVERVEVLTGGGSATYGADAVAGVVNFVMKDDFEGVEINVGASGYQHNNNNEYIQGLMDQRNFDYPNGGSGIEGKSYNIDLTMGGTFAGGKGHATAYATWRQINEMRQETRDYSSCALNSAGTACGGSSTAPLPNTFFAPIVNGEYDLDQEVWWSLNQDGSFSPYDGSNVYNYAPVNHFMRPDTRYTMGAFVNYEVSDVFRPYMEISYMHDRTAAQIAESGTFYAFQARLDVDSPLFSDAQRQQFYDQFGPDVEQVGAYIGKRNVEGGPRMNNLEHSAYRIVAGSEGYLSANWSYDLSFQYGSTSSSTAYVNDFYIPYVGQALGAEGYDSCGEGCTPYQVFTPGGVTGEAADQLGGVAIMTGVTSQRIVNGYLTGELDATFPTSDLPTAAVIGFESREIDFERIADTIYQEGALAGQGGPTNSLAGGYTVKEIFSELSVPLAEGRPGIESMTLDLGLRFSDYSTSGKETTYKVALDYNITSDWKLRASYNRAVRAPNVAELFSATSVGLWQGTDPCAGANPEYTQAQCANTGVSASQYGNVDANPASQYNGLFGGNVNLDPEVADTYTVGIVANPTDNLNFTLDYWAIDIADVIGTVGAQNTLDQCALTGQAQYCDNVVRAPSGSLWRGSNGYVIATNVNVGEETYRGVDLNANYIMEDVMGGTVTARMNGSYYLEKYADSTGQDCAGLVNSVCFPQPDWRHSLTVTYSSDSFWTAQAKWRYFGEVGYDEDVDQLLIADGGIKAQSYLDIVTTFDLNENTSLLFGVNNILDKEPPLVGGAIATNANTIAGFYDTLGRYIHANVTFRF